MTITLEKVITSIAYFQHELPQPGNQKRMDLEAKYRWCIEKLWELGSIQDAYDAIFWYDDYVLKLDGIKPYTPECFKYDDLPLLKEKV